MRDHPGRNPDYLDKVKYIPLRNEEGWYASLGGDVRERYELFDHPLWGQGRTDTNGYLMQRYLLHAGPEPPRVSHYVSAGHPGENTAAKKEVAMTDDPGALWIQFWG